MVPKMFEPFKFDCIIIIIIIIIIITITVDSRYLELAYLE